MPHFSVRSKELLASCDRRICQVMEEAIEIIDIKILEGHRSPARQQQLYAQGRTAPGKVVTNVDGVRVKGKHNYLPSLAIDVAPYKLKAPGGVDWADRETFVFMAGVVLGVAHARGVSLRWGGDWDRDADLADRNGPMDLPHFELVS